MPKRTWTRTPAFWACCAGVATLSAHWGVGWLVDYLDSGELREALGWLHGLALGPMFLISYDYAAIALACYASAVTYTGVAFWQRSSLRRSLRILGLAGVLLPFAMLHLLGLYKVLKDLSAVFERYGAP